MQAYGGCRGGGSPCAHVERELGLEGRASVARALICLSCPRLLLQLGNATVRALAAACPRLEWLNLGCCLGVEERCLRRALGGGGTRLALCHYLDG